MANSNKSKRDTEWICWENLYFERHIHIQLLTSSEEYITLPIVLSFQFLLTSDPFPRLGTHGKPIRSI